MAEAAAAVSGSGSGSGSFSRFWHKVSSGKGKGVKGVSGLEDGKGV